MDKKSWFGSRIKTNNEYNEIKNPITFHDESISEKGIKPISSFESNVNSYDKFAITANTEGGKYIRAGLLYYKLDSVEIYAPINCIIMVNNVNKTLFIREAENLSAVIAPEDPEQKRYIILYTDLEYEDSENEFPFRWESVVGRSKAYESVKLNASVVDVDKSIVLPETVAIKDALSVREFANYIKNSNLCDSENDDFDIEIYAGSDYI